MSRNTHYHHLTCLVLIVFTFGFAAFDHASGQALTHRPQGNLGEAPVGEMIDVYASFGPRISLEEHLPLVQAMDKKERREYALNLLKETAASAQAEAIEYLEEMERDGNAVIGHQIWLNNVLSFKATAEVIAVVSQIPNVLRVNVDPRTTEAALDHPASGVPAPAPSPTAPQGAGAVVGTNLQTINADDVWAMGYTGRDVLVAIIDTRVNFNHPDLVNRNWTNPGEIAGDGIDNDGNGFIDDTIGWDFGGAGDNSPFSTSTNLLGDGHGTAVAGIVVGDGSSGSQTGVAPGATAMYCSLSGALESNWWVAYQYAVDNGAEVIASSNSRKWNFNPQPDYANFRQATDMELLAGVIHANSIGNQGNQQGTFPIPFNISVPGNCPAPWIHPSQVLAGGISAVMGCGAVLPNTFTVAQGSSGRGPAAWTQADADATLGVPYLPTMAPYNDYLFNGGAGLGLIKPDVCAPTNVASLSNAYVLGNPTSWYLNFGGTSAATPHLGGMMCLLLDVDPTLTPEEMARIIMLSAVDLGANGKDNVFGAGRIDCLAAVNLLLGERGGLMEGDVIMMTDSTTDPSPLSHMREGKKAVYINAQGVALPADWGNGAVEHIDNSPYCLIGQGKAPFGVYLLDFSTGAATPTAHLLGNATGKVYDIEFDPNSGNVYLASGSDILVVSSPISPASVMGAVYASPGISFTAGIAVELGGTRLLGATASSTYRICPGDTSASVLFSQVGGANGIDTDPTTGDIFVNSYGASRVDRYTVDGVFIETVLGTPHIDGPCDVEYNPENGQVYTVSRNSGAGTLCILGFCLTIPVGSQNGNDNVVVKADGYAAALTAGVQNVFPNHNTGDTANIAVVSSPWYDLSFELQPASGSPVAPFKNRTGTANVVRPSALCNADGVFPSEGSNWLEINADGSDAASPPGVGTGPVGASVVSTTLLFDPKHPILEMDLAFVSAEGVGQGLFNDFGGAVVTDGVDTVTVSLLDTFSQVTGNSACYGGDEMMGDSVQFDLALAFPGATRGTVLTLQLFCGNAQDHLADSRLYVDNIRLSSASLQLDITRTGVGSSVFRISGANPFSPCITLFGLTPACPRSAGPILGLHQDALATLFFPQVPPIFTNANASGTFVMGLNIPPGFTIEARTVEISGIFPIEFSNIEGPLFF